MDINAFAEKYRVRLDDKRFAAKFRLSWSERVVPGRFGEITDGVYGERDTGAFNLKFIAVPRTAVMTGALRNRYRAALDAGLTLKHKYGDAESTFYFDPANGTEARLAIRLVGARVKRQGKPATPEMRARLAVARALRNTPLQGNKAA